MEVNKVIINSRGTRQTVVDLTDTTATANDVIAGKDFYLANGVKATGNYVPQEGIEEISTAAEMDELLTLQNVGNVYRYVGTTTGVYQNGSLYVVRSE